MIPEWMIISSFRYCLGRASYVVGECADWIIEHNDDLSERVRNIFLREIREALDEDRAGMDMDRWRWEEVLEVLE